MEFAIFVHRKRLEMKKFYYLLLVVVALSSGLQSCDNGKTYAEMKEDEADAINSYINQNDIKVISEAEFAAQDSTNLADNEYVLLEESGVYMHVSYRGNGKEVLSDGSYDMIARFVEVALQTRSEMFEAGDTLMANMHILNPDYYIEGEDFKLTISDGSYSASFKKDVVEAYLNGEGSYRELAVTYNIPSEITIREWVLKYNGHEKRKASGTGGNAIMTKGRKTTFDERVEIVQYCIAHNHNYAKTSQQFGISYQQARNYTIKYEKQGVEALRDRRGKRKPEAEMSEIERLRAENRILRAEKEHAQMEADFLKKLAEIERRRG